MPFAKPRHGSETRAHTRPAATEEREAIFLSGQK